MKKMTDSKTVHFGGQSNNQIIHYNGGSLAFSLHRIEYQ